jgi:ABC-type Zn uptake system ZnuABC Zn-binding protein ZnuA
MTGRWIASFVLAALLGFAAAGCDRQPAARAPGAVRVVVTIAPLAGLVQPMLPADASLKTLIPPGRSEHGYELTSGDVAALAQADVVVFVGLGLDAQVESFLAKHPNSHRRDVCFSNVAGIAPGPAPKTHADDHAPPGHHDDDDDHHHGGSDPHLWLDPDLCLKLVPAVETALRAADPSAPAAADLLARITEFDSKAKARLEPFKGRAIVTHHAAWTWFAGHYGLTVAAVIRPIETAEPTVGAINEVIDAIRQQGIKAIFVEPQFNRKAATRIAEETGVAIGELDPLGDGDWFKMMHANVEAVANALAH